MKIPFEYINEQLMKNKTQSEIANNLGISRKTLYNWLQKYGIENKSKIKVLSKKLFDNKPKSLRTIHLQNLESLDELIFWMNRTYHYGIKHILQTAKDYLDDPSKIDKNMNEYDELINKLERVKNELKEKNLKVPCAATIYTNIRNNRTKFIKLENLPEYKEIKRRMRQKNKK